MKKDTNKVENVTENETSVEEAAVDQEETGATTVTEEAAPEKKKLGKWAKIGIGAGIAAVTVIAGILFGKSKKDDADDLLDGDDFDSDVDTDSDDSDSDEG